MHKFILGALIALCSLTVKAQGETNNWYFGENSGMHFNALTPQAITGSVYANQGCASISDAAGNLLFYTDGHIVYNKQHQIMVNGYPISGSNESCQSSIIIPKPGAPNHYYIFSNTFGFTLNLDPITLFSYSEVDMTLNGNNGAVISRNNLISNNSNCRMSAVKNSNGDGYWVGIVDYETSKFKMHSVTASGISSVPVVSNTISPSNVTMSGLQGCMKFSPDGTKLLLADYYIGTSLYDFDNATGIVTNPKVVNNLLTSYGVEFSPSSNLAYVSTINHEMALYQYDLTAANIPTSQKIITIGNSLYQGNPLGQLQLASNGKIYFSNFHSFTIGEVNDPDLVGAECNYNPYGVQMIASRPKFGLPNFLQSFFNNLITTQKYCSGSTTKFTLANPQNVANVVWDFGDGSTAMSGLTVMHDYLAIGDYVATATITLNTGIVMTRQRLIKIVTLPIVANVVPNRLFCGQNAVNYVLSQHNTAILGTQSSADYGIQYFASANEAEYGLNALPDNYTLNFGTWPVYAKVYSLDNPTCYALTQFNISLNQQPTATQPSEYVICESAPYNGVELFNLQTKNDQILNGQDQSVFVVSYHPTANDAINNTNALPYNYTNTIPTEVLHVRVTNSNASGCYATTELTLKVIQSPAVTTVSDYLLCDDASNDGVASFDVNTKTTEVLNGQSATTFSVSYHLNANDAQNNINPITVPINNTVQNQLIHYRISVNGNSNCYAVGSFKLVVTKLPVANSVRDQFLCDNGNNGSEVFNLNDFDQSVLGNQNVGEFNITYHLTQSDADNRINTLPLSYSNVSNPQTVFARIENSGNNNCYATTSFKMGLYVMPVANTVSNQFACSENANAVFQLNSQEAVLLGSQSTADFTVSYHLSQNEANAGSNPLSVSYTNVTNPQTIFIRMENKLGRNCYATTSFQILVREKPVLHMTDEYSICEGTSITISAPSGFDSYLWSNGAVDSSTVITAAGNYAVTVTKDYGDIVCDQTQSFVVHNSNIAVINDINISDWTVDQNAIEIIVTGDGDYGYSVDGNVYQQSNIFTGLVNGTYMVYVRDKKGCGIATMEVQLLMYPKFFTPNGDGHNDTWNISRTDKEPNLSFSIFDRFGKLLKVVNNNDIGWDGTYLGNPLPATDYWFILKRQNGKEYKGHFALKR